MAQVRIVTDSTADIPSEVASRLEITVVPAYVQLGTRSYQDGIELSREQFYAQLPILDVAPTTAVPPVEGFASAYRRLKEKTDQLIVITVSARLSGMYDVATIAARQAPELDIRVIDSGQATMGLGWLVIAAAEAAAAGNSAEEISAIVDGMKPRVRVFAALDTTEYLRRSGRVSWARAKAAEILSVRPIVSLIEGQVRQLGRARTMHQALERLVALCKELGSLERLAILHTYSPLVDELRRRLSVIHPIEGVLTVVATTAIGAHVGPRGLGVATVGAK